MAETADRSDMGLGLGLLFGVVAILGAFGMYLGHANQLLAGWSYAVAVAAGALAVGAIHRYG